MKQTFYSNGKLLITGEYVVLDGATAFALPTKFGQFLNVEEGKNKAITWKSYDADASLWFTCEISFEEIISKKNIKTQDAIKTTLVELLQVAYRLNPEFLEHSDGYAVTTTLTFPRLWGLGTSSTLINNMAQWLKIDAYALLRQSFGGSGYDIACAQNDQGILYRLEKETQVVCPVAFKPEFIDSLYFVYLNQKQNSRTAIANYNHKKPEIQPTVTKISHITEQLLATSSQEEFARLLEAHESLLSGVLEMTPVKTSHFPDFNGTVKSLGAWGGDFVLAVSSEDPTSYFQAKGYPTLLRYRDMIK